MSEWYAKDISKKVKTGIKTKGMSGKPIVTEAPYGYVKDPDNKDFWIIDEEAAEVVRLIFRLFIGGKNRNQIAVYLTQEQIPTPTFYMKDRGRGTCKNKTLGEDNRCKWNKATLTNILTRQEYCGDVVNFKTTKHFRDKHNHYVDRSQWHITENVHEPIISRSDFETVQRILENAPVRRPNGDGEIHPLSGLLFCKDCGAKCTFVLITGTAASGTLLFAASMRPLDERSTWAAKSKKEYDLDENGERIRLPSGRYKTHKVDLTGWNDKDNTLLWRKAWADYTNDFLERNGSPERIDHRSNAERGIDELPTVHMGVAACQMEKKGIATEKGELNRSIQKTNRLIREIRAQIGKLKEWIADLFKARETAPKQPPQSPNLANLLMKYLSVQREKSRKYSQSWQRQHATDELKTIAAAVNYLSEHGISNLDELDDSLSSVSDKAYSIRAGMKTAEERMKKLQKLIEYGKNYTEYKPIHDELKKLQNGWTNKRDKYEEAHRAELTLWNAASRYLHANLTDTKTLPISKWKQEYADLKVQRDTDYTKLKATRADVSELQKIRKCVDIALRADQPEQAQSRTKRHDIDR